MYGGYGSSSAALSSSTLPSNYSGIYASANTAANWATPVLLISVVAAILIYFIFLAKRNEGKFTGFVGFLYEFLHFKKLAVEGILKMLYIASALFITIMSFTLISADFMSFLLMLIGGNIGLRVAYELMLVLLIVCKNTSEINKKLSDK